MSKMQDVEQGIIDCMRVVDDLKLIAKHANCGSDFTNVLHGIAELYHYKLETLWEDYEGAVKEYYAFRDAAAKGKKK